MTLDKFIKQLQKLSNDGWGRAQVAVNKDSLNDGNRTWNICEIVAMSAEMVGMVDGDGFQIENKDGSERSKATIILKGHWHDEPPAGKGG